MTPRQATATAALLSAQPLTYRHYGVWWWHVKDELRRNGVQMAMLGPEDDEYARGFYSGMTVDELDEAAWTEQQVNATLNPLSEIVTAPDGADYTILDRDVE